VNGDGYGGVESEGLMVECGCSCRTDAGLVRPQRCGSREASFDRGIEPWDASRLNLGGG